MARVTVVGGREQVLSCEVIDLGDEPRLFPTLGELMRQHAGIDDGYLPLAVLAQAAKVGSDGILAALDLQSCDEALDPWGPRALLRGFGEAQDGQDGRDVPPLESAARSELQAFLAQAAAAEANTQGPLLGYYAFHPALAAVFRRDRFLQRRALSPTLATTLTRCLLAKPSLHEAYRRHLTRLARLTHRLSASKLDLRGRLAAMAEDRPFEPPLSPTGARPDEVLFPPSFAPENDHASLEAFLAQVKRGPLSPPTEEDGFYFHQLFTLEPLVAPARASDSDRLRIGPRYEAVLQEIARGVLMFSRETHVKQLEIPAPVAAPVSATTHRLGPKLSLEPQPEYYERSAAAFSFLRSVLKESWPEDVLERKTLRLDGALQELRPSAATIGEELEGLESSFIQAARIARAEIAGAHLRSPRASDSSPWRRQLTSPDNDLDLRAVVPLAGEGQGPYRVLALIGWQALHLRVAFAVPPATSPADVTFVPEAHILPCPVVREWVLPQLYSPQAWRKLCDAANGDEAKLLAEATA